MELAKITFSPQLRIFALCANRRFPNRLILVVNQLSSLVQITNNTSLNKKAPFVVPFYLNWLREMDLNQRPSGYEPDELPDCSIPR